MRYFLLSSLIIALALSSCIEPLQKHNRILESIRIVKLTNNTVIAHHGFALSRALELNEYLQAPDTDKIAIEDKYFPNYKIRVQGDTCLLILEGRLAARYISNNQDLTQEGAKWTILVHSYYDARMSESLSSNIECSAEGEYTITAGDDLLQENYDSEAVLSKLALLVKHSQSDKVNSFLITGTGNIAQYEHHKGELSIDFTIPEGLNYKRYIQKQRVSCTRVPVSPPPPYEEIYFRDAEFSDGYVDIIVKDVYGYDNLYKAIRAEYDRGQLTIVTNN